MITASDFERRREELHSLMASAEINMSINRILDLARDFTQNKERFKEAIVISANFKLLEKDFRQNSISVDELQKRRNQILYQMLDLIELIEKDIVT